MSALTKFLSTWRISINFFNTFLITQCQWKVQYHRCDSADGYVIRGARIPLSCCPCIIPLTVAISFLASWHCFLYWNSFFLSPRRSLSLESPISWVIEFLRCSNSPFLFPRIPSAIRCYLSNCTFQFRRGMFLCLTHDRSTINNPSLRRTISILSIDLSFRFDPIKINKNIHIIERTFHRRSRSSALAHPTQLERSLRKLCQDFNATSRSGERCLRVSVCVCVCRADSIRKRLSLFKLPRSNPRRLSSARSI